MPMVIGVEQMFLNSVEVKYFRQTVWHDPPPHDLQFTLFVNICLYLFKI